MLIFDVFHNMLFLFHVVVLVCKLESTVLERHHRFFSIWSCSTHYDANSGVSKFRSHNNIQWVLSSKYNERAHQNLSQTLTFLVWSLDSEKEKEKKKQISHFFPYMGIEIVIVMKCKCKFSPYISAVF